MTRAILLTHGTLGEALMTSVESILGPQEEVVILSNKDKALDQIADSIVPHLKDSHSIVFVDFCGGSPFMACKSLECPPETTAIVSGVNLPMLLSFFTKRNKLNFAELSQIVKTDGLRGIQLHNE